MSGKRVLIIGGGASGLLAASAAAEAGADVTVLESAKKPAAKLRRTGNGHCNMTNTGDLPAFYEPKCRAFAEQVLKNEPVERTLAFFREIGIVTRTRDGLVYPMSEEASCVADALVRAAEERGARIRMNELVTGAAREKGGFSVFTEGWRYESDAVILACGSPAGLPKGSPDGYGIAEALGHSVNPARPALVPLRCDPPLPELAGLRVRGEVTLLVDGREEDRETGQIQFSAKGISGICVMNLSIAAGRAADEGRRVSLLLNLLGHCGEPDDVLARCLPSVIPERLLKVLRRKHGDAEIVSLLRGLPLPVDGTAGFPDAQAARGGVPAEEVNPDTMESRITEGLYFSGEILDVTGKCGGANLQFAWSTGRIAGRSAAGSPLHRPV
ncbi:MAG: aminoacetone oxidase family FAD-binding enzyme [Lachnospiraceae bacterium]|nr:aminoacetone oxidase family FAD-binding enzyme [Lachnospiraceae bacterium]